MTITINQFLVFCLILVLVGFLVVLAILAKHAIELIKKAKVLVGNSEELVSSSKAKVDEIGDKIVGAATAVAEDTAPAIKALGATAAGLTAFNVVKVVGRTIIGRGGIIATIADNNQRRKTNRDLRKSRKMVKAINKQTALENKALKKSKKVAKKAAKAERRARREAK